VLALTFYAGMAYENHRIKVGIEEAFSGFGESDTSTEDDVFGEGEGDAVEGESAPEPVELVENSPVEVQVYDGTMTVTLLSTTMRDEAAADDVLTRNLAFNVKVENTGDAPLDPSMSGHHFETDAGRVLDFAGVFCNEDSLPSDTLDPGQFAQGCESTDLPDDAGRLVFESFTPELYLTVPAA
jgi:hypothetical protein